MAQHQFYENPDGFLEECLRLEGLGVTHEDANAYVLLLAIHEVIDLSAGELRRQLAIQERHPQVLERAEVAVQ